MKALLISPLDPKKPGNLQHLMGGENTYTRMLLAHPLNGIDFIYFKDALERGEISYHWTQLLLLLLQKLRILPPGPRVQSLTLNSEYDLVYAHAHPVKIFKKKVPLVVSDSSSNLVFLSKYLNWPAWKLGLGQVIKKALYAIFGIIDGEVNTNQVQASFVFSKWARRIKNSEFRNKDWEVIYPGLPDPKGNNNSSRLLSNRKNIKILFVGVWFERKGGLLLLKAFMSLRQKYPNLILTILGPVPKKYFHILIYEKNITQYDFVPYAKLQKYYKSHDILVHVPPEIEGYGMTVPEAMSYGVVPVVSDICALPEFIIPGKSGLLVRGGSVVSLKSALEKLIRHPRLRRKLSLGARTRFKEKFSLPVFQKDIYDLFTKTVKDF